LAVHAKLAPNPGWLAIVKVIEAEELVTVLPDASSTVTTGWVAQVVPLLLPPGWVVNTTCEAAPKMVKLLEMAVVRPVFTALSV
jgi:hypothetical protein